MQKCQGFHFFLSVNATVWWWCRRPFVIPTLSACSWNISLGSGPPDTFFSAHWSWRAWLTHYLLLFLLSVLLPHPLNCCLNVFPLDYPASSCTLHHECLLPLQHIFNPFAAFSFNDNARVTKDLSIAAFSKARRLPSWYCLYATTGFFYFPSPPKKNLELWLSQHTRSGHLCQYENYKDKWQGIEENGDLLNMDTLGKGAYKGAQWTGELIRDSSLNKCRDVWTT